MDMPSTPKNDPPLPVRRGQLFDQLIDSVSGDVEPGERFDVLCSGASYRLERIVSTGQSTPPGEWYDQSDDEWVVLLSGAATLRFADPAETVELTPGDWLLIPAHCRHRVEWTATDRPTIWLALHTDVPASR